LNCRGGPGPRAVAPCTHTGCGRLRCMSTTDEGSSAEAPPSPVAHDDPPATAAAAGGSSPEPSAGLGEEADTIVIEIDYAIISHFSQHLYGSPNKAVEELVANGFDALAGVVDVWVPGPQVSGAVLVWDDGQSMDIGGLKALWEIARSPKSKIPKRQISGTINGVTVTRDMIGKFGIGKLASYAVGDRITHYCRRDSEFLVASVDYTTVLDEKRGKSPYKTEVRRLSEAEMNAAVQALFVQEPDNLGDLLARKTWTLAHIGGLRPDVDLKAGRLGWIIGNGMPLRPDFTVNVNGAPVAAKLAKDAKETWTLETASLNRAIASAWQDAVRADEHLDGTLLVGPSMSSCVPLAPKKGDKTVWVATSDEIVDKVIRFPNLGDVRVTIRLYTNSLLAQKDEDRPRTHGFFVMVRGRLVNSEDELLFLNDPSFTSFYRTQFVIEADALDEDLLADRERLKRSSPAAAELALLQRALNSAARSYFEKQDEEDVHKASFVSLLPVGTASCSGSPSLRCCLPETSWTREVPPSSHLKCAESTTPRPVRCPTLTPTVETSPSTKTIRSSLRSGYRREGAQPQSASSASSMSSQ
jgi:hypothetical protein